MYKGIKARLKFLAENWKFKTKKGGGESLKVKDTAIEWRIQRMDLWFNSILDTDEREFVNRCYVRRLYPK